MKEEEERKMKEEEERKKKEAEDKQRQKEEETRREEERLAAEKAAEAAALRTGLRLNKTLIPYHYDLSLWPRFYEGDDFSFSGNVTIHFTAKEDTDVIVLQANKLMVREDRNVLK